MGSRARKGWGLGEAPAWSRRIARRWPRFLRFVACVFMGAVGLLFRDAFALACARILFRAHTFICSDGQVLPARVYFPPSRETVSREEPRQSSCVTLVVTVIVHCEMIDCDTDSLSPKPNPKYVRDAHATDLGHIRGDHRDVSRRVGHRTMFKRPAQRAHTLCVRCCPQ